VTYRLKEEDEAFFHIDERSGEIKTRKMFDRETKDVYQVTVFAQDGAPSVEKKDGTPNISMVLTACY